MRSISMNITEANTKGDISCKLTEMLTKGCRRVEVGRQLVAKPFCTKLHFLPQNLNQAPKCPGRTCPAPPAS